MDCSVLVVELVTTGLVFNCGVGGAISTGEPSNRVIHH